jgi:prepilin-type N-terminal cleavage/methylation domain-containing protein
MNRKRLIKLGQNGDTIVEVMIAVVIIGTVLAGAFTLTNRNTRSIRDAEEHSQALQMLQGQLEQLRASSSTNAYNDYGSNFCFDEDGNIQNLGSGAFGCQVTDSLYKFSIVKAADGGTSPTLFTLTTQWDGILATTAQERLVYKVQLAP